MSLKTEIIKDMVVIENDIGTPSFTFGTSSYSFIPSITEFKRELDTGGYKLIKMMTASVRKLNINGTTIFSTYPTAQDVITYTMDGLRYRIESIKHDPTGAYFRLIAQSDTKGL